MDEDPPDVGLDEDDRQVEGESTDGRCSCRADAGKAGKDTGISRKDTLIPVHDNFCTVPECQGPPVVPQSLPGGKHFGKRGSGKGGEVREGGDECREPDQDPLDLRLLEHDLRDENSIRIGGVPPGHRAAGLLIMRKDDLLELRNAGDGTVVPGTGRRCCIYGQLAFYRQGFSVTTPHLRALSYPLPAL